MRNLEKYNVSELETSLKEKIDGGCFAYDLGWFLRHSLTGSFTNSGRATVAMLEYHVHYATATKCK